MLNIGFDASSGLKLGNDFIEFKARFGGVARDIVVPVDHVVAIYARENGQGMAFPVPSEPGAESAAPPAEAAPKGLRLAPAGDDAAEATPEAAPDDDQPPPSGPSRPTLKRIK